MPRKPNTTERRAEIVRGLLAAIAEHGYDKATIQLIARHAGLAPGLIHYHFENKREILVELVRTMAQYALTRYEQLAADAVSPREKLRAYLQSRLGLGEGANAGAVAAWVMIGAEAVRQPEVREVYSEVVAAELQRARELIEACLADQGRSRARAGELAAALLALMEGAFQLASAAQAVMPVGYAASMAEALLDRYIVAEQPA
jgi:TetR/AcrR family transcriptional repressor of bet genes